MKKILTPSKGVSNDYVSCMVKVDNLVFCGNSNG